MEAKKHCVITIALFLILLAVVVITPVLYCHSSCNCSIFKETCRTRPSVTDAPSMETCIQFPDVMNCPKMVGPDELSFYKYDYRIDERPVKYYPLGKAAMSILAPDLAKQDYTKINKLYPALAQVEKSSKVLVYCNRAYGAFYASKVLLKAGYTDINTHYYGGLPFINSTIVKDNNAQVSAEQPTKNLCYITGPSDQCPTIIPVMRLTNKAEVATIVNSTSYNLADMRPTAMFNSGSLVGAISLAGGQNDTAAFDTILSKKNEVWITFCMKGVFGYMGARNLKKLGFKNVYYFDNGGYPELKDIDGFESTV